MRSTEVLLIEDNKADVELAFRAWKEVSDLHGHGLESVPDGAEALDFIFGTGKYNEVGPATQLKLILLDLKLLKINGFEVLKAIMCDERINRIPVVVWTSSAVEDDMIEAYRLGASSYIVKPITFQEFTETIWEIGFYWLLRNQLPNHRF